MPLLVVFEDLHWIDPTSLAFVERLARAIADRPILLLITERPERPSGGDVPDAAEIELERLSGDEAMRMSRSIAGRVHLAPGVMLQILQSSEGVPLFIEELTKTAIESEGTARNDGQAADGYQLPSTLQGSVLARLDRLPVARPVAQAAAVIGRDFTLDLVAAALALPPTEVKRALQLLIRARLITTSESLDGGAFSFSHALIREAAYATLLRGKRRQLHGRVAEALERLRPETADNEPEQLAHQLSEAGDQVRAVPYWRKAGEIAASRAAHIEAAHHYRAALVVVDRLPDGPERIQLELELQLKYALSASASRGYGAPDVEDAYGRARTLCEMLGNPPPLYAVLRGLCTFYIVRDDLEAAGELAQECLAIGRATGRAEHLIEGHNALGYVLVHGGELVAGAAELEKAVALYREHHRAGMEYGTEQDPAVAALSLLSHASWVTGESEAALGHRDQALEIARSLNHPFTLAYAHTYAAMFGNIRRDWEDGARHARTAAGLSQEHGFDVWFATSSMQLALAEGALGKPKEAVATVAAILEAYQRGGAELTASYYFGGLAENLLADGQPAAALEAIDKGIAHAERHGERFYVAMLRVLRADALQSAGRGQPDILAELEAARAIAGRQVATEFARRAEARLAGWQAGH